MSLVFVSYSHEDTAFVLKLIGDLLRANVPVWLDRMHIKIGPWDVAVEQALKRASHVVCVLSPASVKSRNVLDEIGMAIDERKILIPILIDDCERPLRVRREQYIDFRHDYQSGLRKLLSLLPRVSTLQEQGHDSLSPIQESLSLDQLLTSMLPAHENGAFGNRGIQTPVLLFQYGDAIGQVRVTKQNVVIGRNPECHIVVAVATVSGRHIEIGFEDYHWVIEDLGSRNGTWINGNRLRYKQELQDGDTIDLALAVRLQFSKSVQEAQRRIIDAQAANLRVTPLGDPELYVPPKHDLLVRKPTGPLDKPLVVLSQSREVIVNGRVLDPSLTDVQFRFLELLYRNDGAVCSRDTIADYVWPDTGKSDVSSAVIDAVANRVCERLAEANPDWNYISYVPEQGYKLDIRPNNQSSK